MLRKIAYVLLAIIACLGLSAWTHGNATPDTLLVVIIGDSNTGSGECFNATYDTLSPVSVIQLKHNFTTATAQEPLDLTSMGTSCGTNTSGVSGQVGSTTKLVQMLVSNNKVPAGVARIVIIPSGWAGTGLNVAGNAAWVPAGTAGCPAPVGNNACGCALDGGGTCSLAAGKGLYGMINQAKATWPRNRIWFFNVVEGANDGGMSQANWTAAAQALFTDIRSKYADAVNAPVLWTGIPPDRVNSSLGAVVNLGNVAIAISNIGSNISKAYYVNPNTAPILHSYFNNAWVHFNSASQRGGVPNFLTNGNNTDGTPHVWSAGATYTVAGAFLATTTVVASDGFIYTCIATSTGNDPTTDGGVHWSKQWDTTAAVSDSDSLAGRQYQQLIVAGF